MPSANCGASRSSLFIVMPLTVGWLVPFKGLPRSCVLESGRGGEDAGGDDTGCRVIVELGRPGNSSRRSVEYTLLTG